MPDNMTWEDVVQKLAAAVWACPDMDVFCGCTRNREGTYCPAREFCDADNAEKFDGDCELIIMAWAREQVGE